MSGGNQRSWRNWLVASVAVGLGSAFAAGAQGCTVTTGDGPYYGTDASSPDTDSAAPVANACNTCLFQGCRGQFSVCANAPECIAIYQCAIAPACVTSEACVQACYDAHPTGQASYNALVDCDHVGQCSTCQATCGVAASSCTVPDAGTDAAPAPDAAPPVDACDACVGSKCAAEKQACAPASECDVYTQCVLACGDQPCADKCGTDHAAGKAASTQLGTCTTGSCKTECGL